MIVVHLLDEGVPRDGEAQRPRLGHTVFIDLAARRVSPRVLCEVRTGENARTGSSEAGGCSASRYCSVSASSSGARITIAPWRGPMDAECADLLAELSSENVPAGSFLLGE